MTSAFQKKSVSTILALSMAISAPLFAPKRAEAIIGLVSGTAPVAIAGAILAAASLPTGVIVGVAGGIRPKRLAISLIAGATLTLLGVLLLEDGSESIQFRAIGESEAQGLQLSEAERRAFNDSVEELNLIAEDAGLEAQKYLREGEETAIEAARKVWKASLDREAPELQSALSKVLRAKFGAFIDRT